MLGTQCGTTGTGLAFQRAEVRASSIRSQIGKVASRNSERWGSGHTRHLACCDGPESVLDLPPAFMHGQYRNVLGRCRHLGKRFRVCGYCGAACSKDTIASGPALNPEIVSARGRARIGCFVTLPLAGGASSNCVFNDVTAGNNAVPGQPGYGSSNAQYQATVGYDLATGLGFGECREPAKRLGQAELALSGHPPATVSTTNVAFSAQDQGVRRGRKRSPFGTAARPIWRSGVSAVNSGGTGSSPGQITILPSMLIPGRHLFNQHYLQPAIHWPIRRKPEDRR